MPIIRTSDNNYEVKRVLPNHNDEEELKLLKNIRQLHGYDVMLIDFKINSYLFCNKIEDAKIISEYTFEKIV